MPLHVRGIPVPIANESTGSLGGFERHVLSFLGMPHFFGDSVPQEVGESNDGAGELPRAVDWKPTHFSTLIRTVSSGRL